MNDLARAILDAYHAALAAIDGRRATSEAVGRLTVDGPATVIALGKAAPAMTRGAFDTLGHRLMEAIVVSDHDEEVPSAARLMIGGHPYPDNRSKQAGAAALALAGQVRPDHTILFLISGGGSSLAEVPATEVSIDDLVTTTRLLMAAGVPIGQLNVVRRHLSRIKNGGLLRAASGYGRAVTLAISDVIDGPPSDIASGPTLADDSDPADALSIITDRRLEGEIPAGVIRALENPHRRPAPSIDHLVEIVADRTMAARAAADSLRAAGFQTHIDPAPLVGDAIDVARAFCATPSPGIRVATGETTMHVTGKGRGGRNQSAALAAALAMDGGRPGVFAALATDGIDGPTDAAGAVVDGQTAERIRGAGLDPRHHLDTDDAYPALAAADALVMTGPTGSNVADIWLYGQSA